MARRDDIERVAFGIVRTGRVSSVGAAKHTARVHFEDDGDDAISFDLSVLATRQGDYSLPAVGALVLCLLVPGASGDGFVLGVLYSDEDDPPTDEEGARVVAGNDVRLGSEAASDAVALAPATKDEIQKVLDYAQGIATAIQAGVPVPQDGGANLKATMVAALPVVPSLVEPGATKVVAE